MLPPSPPQYAQPSYGPFTSSAYAPPVPSPYARETSTTSAHRSGSSMSISSMLGSTSEETARDSTTVQRVNSFPSSSVASLTAPLHTPGPPLSHPQFANGHPSYRAHTPDAYKNGRGEHTRPSRAYSGGTPQRPFSGVPASSPEIFRLGPPMRVQQPQMSPPFSANSEGIPSFGDPVTDPSRRSSLNALEHLISSRQPGFRTPPIERIHGHDLPQTLQKPANGELMERRVIEEPINNREAIFRHKPNSATDSAYQDLDLRASATTQIREPPNNKSDHVGGPSVSNYPFLSRSTNHAQVIDDRTPSSNRIALELLRESSYATPLNGPQSAHSTELWSRSNEVQYTGLSPAQQDSRQQHIQQIDSARLRVVHGSPSISTPAPRSQNGLTADRLDQHIGSIEESQHTLKSLPNLLVDNNKRNGRISPLPQAVQGAQGRVRGPASEPGIKNEFARMFSGIGSGVGSAMSTPVPQELGASISIPSSPTRMEEPGRRTPFGLRSEAGEQSKPRVTTSRGGRRSRKVKDEDSRIEIGNISAQGLTRSFSARGAKRSRQSYNIHNHA